MNLSTFKTWAIENNMVLNMNKTKEIIFRNRRMNVPMLQPILEVQRVLSLKLLWVTLQHKFSMNEHVDLRIADCSNGLFALNIQRCHGMGVESLREVFMAKIISRFTYAAPAWWGLTSARYILFLNKAKKLNFQPPDGLSIEEPWRQADNKLFHKICGNDLHVLHKFLPNKKDTGYNLRRRKHSFSLPSKDDRNVISRVLFHDIVLQHILLTHILLFFSIFFILLFDCVIFLHVSLCNRSSVCQT